jgi:hypothetical protein
MQDAFLPGATAGDLRCAQFVLRVADKLWRLGKFARDAQCAADLKRKQAVAVDCLAEHRARPSTAADAPIESWELAWDFLTEMLPHRAGEIAAIHQEYRAAVAADEAQLREPQQAKQQPSPAPASPQRDLSVIDHRPPRHQVQPVPLPALGKKQDELQEFLAQLPVRPELTPAEPRPLTRKQRKLQARARRAQRASAARTERERCREQGASANRHNPAENDELAYNKAG